MLSKRLMYVYFIGTALALLWIFINFGLWCDDNGDVLELEQKKVQLFQQKYETQKTKIGVLLKHKDELNAELKKAQDRIAQLTNKHEDIPTIYIITPTHNRLEQKADLTRLSHTLRLVPNIHWIVVEDAELKTDIVANFLTTCKLSYTHLYAATPKEVKLHEKDPNWLKPRGVLQRNAAVNWLRRQRQLSGVVYFADDDNTYDLKLFEEMRYTQKVSVWPVGIVGYLKYESPKVRNNQVTGWYTYWKPNRQFAMDMAGFALNARLIKDHPHALFRVTAGRGNQESDFLSQLGVEMKDLEPKADNCRKVLVWHTRTEKSSLKNEEKMLKLYGYNSDLDIEV